MVMSNELPRMKDSSGALVNRLLVLRQTRSFLGHEDHGGSWIS
jgi:phage/plasmid-associated DNA primase